MAKKSKAVPRFIFVGDSGKRKKARKVKVWDENEDRFVIQSEIQEVKVDPANPSTVTVLEPQPVEGRKIPQHLRKRFEFTLNGDPVPVDDAKTAEKLAINDHFQQVIEGEAA